MKNPRACSSEVLADDLIVSMVNSSGRSLRKDSVTNEELGCQSLDIALSDGICNVGTDISMLFSVCATLGCRSVTGR